LGIEVIFSLAFILVLRANEEAPDFFILAKQDFFKGHCG
jgi:hypothetical protein